MNKAVKFVGIGCLGLFILSILIGVIGGAGSSSNKTGNENKENVLVENKDGSNKVDQKEEVKPEVLVIKAAELADDFDSNQVAAEAKWKGKMSRIPALRSAI